MRGRGYFDGSALEDRAAAGGLIDAISDALERGEIDTATDLLADLDRLVMADPRRVFTGHLVRAPAEADAARARR